MNKTFFTTALFSITFLLIATISSAQTPLSEAPRRADVPAAWPDCDPKMPDCTKNRLADFFAANLQLPAEAKEKGVGGVVAMEFVVEKNGLIGEIGAMHDPGMGLVAEATRVIELMKSRKMKWVPAEQDGKKIAYRYIIPVSFNTPVPPKEKAIAKTVANAPVDGIYDVVDVRPQFAGCETSTDTIDCTFKKMLAHIKSNMTYPEEAIKHSVHGQVMVEFVVGEDGVVKNVSLAQGIGAGCDQEAMRLVSTMPAFTPGKIAGQPVATRMKLPIYFQLPKKEE